MALVIHSFSFRLDLRFCRLLVVDWRVVGRRMASALPQRHGPRSDCPDTCRFGLTRDRSIDCTS